MRGVFIVAVLLLGLSYAQEGGAGRVVEPGVTHRFSVEGGDNHPTLGASSPKVVLYYWVSYRLNYNKHTTKVLHKLVARHPEEAQVIVRFRSRGYEEEDAIAQVAREVYAQGGDELFWRFHKKIVDTNRPYQLKKEDAIKTAVALGLSKASLERMLKLGIHEDAIQKDTVSGIEMSIFPTSHSVAVLVNTSLQYFSRSTKLSWLERTYKSEKKRTLKALARGVPQEKIKDWLWRKARQVNRSRYRYRYRYSYNSVWLKLLNTEASKSTPVKRHPVTIGDAPVKGSPRATVTIVMFIDPMNTYSRYLVDSVDKLMAANENKLRVVLRFLPSIGYSRSAQLCRAVLAAKKWDKVWPVLEKAIQLRYGFHVRNLKKFATKHGLDLEAFQKHRDSMEIRKKLAKDIHVAHKLGVYAAPVAFVNGIRVQGVRTSAGAKLLLGSILKGEMQPGILSRLAKSVKEDR